MKIVLKGWVVFLSLVLVGLLLPACTVKTHHHSNTAHNVKKLTPGKCVNLGRFASKDVAVSVDKGCIDKRLTTVTVVLYTKNTARGMKESEKMMLALLGYKPKLAHLIQTKDKGIHVFVMIITGKLHH